MGLFQRIFGGGRDRAGLVPLYRAIVAEARRPDWYGRGGVADTIDGRFDMVALILSLVLIRLEAEGEAGRAPSALLTEVFIDDMDGTMREIGFGDVVVGKRIGGMMGALGGRLGAYRGEDRRAALARNLYRGAEPAPGVLDAAEAMSHEVEADLAALPIDALLAGQLK